MIARVSEALLFAPVFLIEGLIHTRTMGFERRSTECRGSGFAIEPSFQQE
jgi:hypothetical protein